jgi:hypothetical protein
LVDVVYEVRHQVVNRKKTPAPCSFSASGAREAEVCELRERQLLGRLLNDASEFSAMSATTPIALSAASVVLRRREVRFLFLHLSANRLNVGESPFDRAIKGFALRHKWALVTT